MQAQFGLSLPVAQQLAREHGQHVEAGIHFVQHRQASGGRAVANPAGLLRSALKEPEKYLLSSFVTPPAQAKPKTQEIALRQQEEAHASQEEIQSQIAELQSETPEAQWRSCKQALHLLLSKAFTQDEWKLLEEACVTGKLSAAHIMREASKAAATLQLQEFVIDLKEKVQNQSEDTQTGLIF